PMPRLFTGLEIPSDVGQSLSVLRGGLPGARWIDPENYHVTLRFIGDVDDVTAHEVASMLGRVRREPFELRAEDLKSFGGREARAIVATLGAVQALMELQAEHERLMQRVGLEPEGRKYTPHVSLARLRESSNRQVADYLALRAPFRSPPFKVSRFVLFSSRASVGGGPYVVEAAYPLAACRWCSLSSQLHRFEQPRLHVEHGRGEAVAVGKNFSHQRERRRPGSGDLPYNARKIEAQLGIVFAGELLHALVVG